LTYFLPLKRTLVGGWQQHNIPPCHLLVSGDVCFSWVCAKGRSDLPQLYLLISSLSLYGLGYKLRMISLLIRYTLYCSFNSFRCLFVSLFISLFRVCMFTYPYLYNKVAKIDVWQRQAGRFRLCIKKVCQRLFCCSNN